MEVIRHVAKADPDGSLRLTIPVGSAGGEYEVAVVVSPKPATNGPARPKTPEELGWPPGFFENVIGSIDDEAFRRYPEDGLSSPVEQELFAVQQCPEEIAEEFVAR